MAIPRRELEYPLYRNEAPWTLVFFAKSLNVYLWFCEEVAKNILMVSMG